MGKVSPVKLFNIRSGSQNDIPEQNYFKRLPKFKLMLPWNSNSLITKDFPS